MEERGRLEMDDLGMLIHDLRNPVGTLAGFAHLLGERIHEMAPDQVQTIVDGIGRSVDRLNGIIDDLETRRRTP